MTRADAGAARRARGLCDPGRASLPRRLVHLVDLLREPGRDPLARAASDTFAGIRPRDTPGFIPAQALGAAGATLLFRWLAPSLPAVPARGVITDGQEDAA